MFIIKPHIFKSYPEIIFGLSTKISVDAKPPFYFNLSYSVGDDKNVVEKSRKDFFESIGLSIQSVAYQRQIHSDIINVVGCGGDCGESDALITNKKNLGIAVIVADCTPVFLYDKKQKVISAIHSGWRGTDEKIVDKTLHKMRNDYNTQPENLIVYIGPSISQINYEVGIEVAEKFDKQFVICIDGKLYLDVSGIIYQTIKNFGIPVNQVQKSELCTFEYIDLLHSYRRDGNLSGRSVGVIAMKGSE